MVRGAGESGVKSPRSKGKGTGLKTRHYS